MMLTSPQLKAHKDNPVAWQQWSSETLSLAKSHQRLIFLSIGYNACHCKWLGTFLSELGIMCLLLSGCHVMERESFSSPEVAAVLNDFFIPIKLDREARPDLDEIYMSYVTATTGSGGWPLNVFLTPDLKPVFGGTYWPGPGESTQLQANASSDETPLTFLDILNKMKEIWTTQKDRCLQSASDITRQLLEFAGEGIHSHSDSRVRGSDVEDSDPPEPLDLDLLDDALVHFASSYDSTYGGFTSSQDAPKFPTPVILTFLLRVGASITYPSTHTRFGFATPIPSILGKESCVKAASMGLYTLLAMSRSGLRDHLGHGFHRYSVTPDWNLPHFEKMLTDNAQLLGCYCDAWALGRDPEILGTIYSLVEYLTSPDSPIIRPEGGWYASEDADSRPNVPLPANVDGFVHEKKEGAFYVWTSKRLQQILGGRDADVVARHFGVKSDGNVPIAHDTHDEFVNQSVLHIAATPSTLAQEFSLPEAEIVRIIKAGKTKLADYRTQNRERPEVDSQLILSWNALAIIALARAASTLATIDRQRAARCRDAAERAISFIRTNMYDEVTGRLTRIYNHNQEPQPQDTNTAFLDDYAYLVQGILAMYDLTFNDSYLTFATKLQSYVDNHFIADTTGAYFQAQRSSEQIFRLKPGTDNSLPSPNGVIVNNLMYLSSYYPDRQTLYIGKARKVLDAFAVEIIQHPWLYVGMLSAVVMDQVGVKRLVVPRNMSDVEVGKVKGFGRVVVKDEVPKIMICEGVTGLCRELRKGELEDGDGEWDLDDEKQE